MYECQNLAFIHSSKTKAENLENDFNEIAATIGEMGWGNGKQKTGFWLEKEEEEEESS